MANQSLNTSVVAVMMLAAAPVVAPALVHFDETDSFTYQTIVRHMVEDDTWFALRYLPAVYPEFREHVPFGFWPYAAAVRVFGEGALPVVATVFTLATYLSIGLIVARRFGTVTALVSVFLLASCESFFLYGSRPLLEPPLLFFTTFACLLLGLGPPSGRTWVFIAVLGALATLIKGPFGLAPVVAFAFALGLVHRSASTVVGGLVVCIVAALPLVGFLLHDRANSGTYWHGYVENQLLASAASARGENAKSLVFPFLSIAGRLWLAVTVSVLALVGRWRLGPLVAEPQRRAERVVGLGVFVLLLLLCVPVRKNWTHVLSAYPALALWAALKAGPFVEAWWSNERISRRLSRGLVAAAVVAWVAVVSGVGALLVPSACVATQGELVEPLRALPVGTAVGVVAQGSPWLMVGLLAAERRLSPEPVSWDELSSREALAHALVAETQWPAEHGGWGEVKRARGWVLVRRDPAPAR
jgi:4-amino-4-deoxy-L-arabinose transferase-like glycosyltransferase